MVTLAEARSKIHVRPIFIFDIALLGDSAPTLYFSDRNVTVGGNDYEDFIDNMPDIQEEVRFINSSGLNSDITIVFKNDKYETKDYLIQFTETYPFNGATVTIQEVYQLEKRSVRPFPHAIIADR